MSKRKYIDIDDTIYMVAKYKDGMKLKKGTAYEKGKYVYPYRGLYDPDGKHKVGVYNLNDGDNDNIRFIKPLGKTRKNIYSKSNIYSIDLDDVNDIIINEGVIETDTDIIMGETDSMFAPLIMEDDNPLQMLIKKALQDKKIDLKHYKNRFSDSSKMSNCKSALFNHGKMSFEKFMTWADVLDLDIEIIITDKKNCANPMNDEHSYSNSLKK